MKSGIAIIIPYRGDRPEFLKNLLRMIQRQTVKPDVIELVNYEPTSEAVDITPRYRAGYEKVSNHAGIDVIAFMEVDDWYANNYLETMVWEWIKASRPDIFGTNYTIYYNLLVKGYFTMHHKTRCSAMSTFIKPGLTLTWPADQDPYTDIHLWKSVPGKVFKPTTHICLGIKHGVGLCGGKSHTDRLKRYTEKGTMDLKGEWLGSVMDEESFTFYWNYFLK